MSSNILAFGIGAIASFGFNFPPRKIQLLFFGIAIIFVIVAIAFLLDSGYSDWSVNWVSMVFNLAGYVVGYVCAHGLRVVLGVDWK